MTTDVPSYEKMPEETRRWGLDDAGFRALSRVPWVVTEKIHGANLCFEVTAQGVRASSRSRWLGPDDDFFGFQTVLARLTPALQALFARLLGEPAGEGARALVYGELYGGGYPHPDVPPVAGVTPIQTGIWYAPDIAFAAFDLATDGPDGKRYLDYARAVDIFRTVEIPYSTPLLVGAYADAMAYPLGFATTIPAGLPALAGNLAEGVVVKPWEAVEVRDERGRVVRPILKRKIAEFAEDERFHQAERPAQAPASEFEALRQHASWLVNEPRLAAARSKLGPVERQGEAGRAALIDAVTDDALVSLAEAWGPRFVGLSAAEQARLRAFLRDEAAALVELYCAPAG